MASANILKPKARLSNSNILFLIAAVIFVLMYLFAIISYPASFMQFQTFFDLFNLNAPLLIMTLGLCIVMIGGGIDISIGSVCGLITMACAVYLQSESGSITGAILIALGIGIAFGILQGYLIAYLEIQPFIITLSGLFLAQGLLTTLHKDPINVTMPAFVRLRDFEFVITWLGTKNRLGVFIPCEIKPGAVLVVILLVILASLMKWSRFGRNVYAVGGNMHSALMLGVNVKRTIFITYVISGLTAGIAGFVYIMTTGAGNVGNAAGAEMKAIASAIIGGTLLNGGVGNLLGAPIGTLTLLVINELIRAAGVQSNFQAMVSGLLLYFFIVLQSIIMSLRDRRRITIALPSWLRMEDKQQVKNQR